MKKKILIWGMSDFPGGIESVIINYLSNFNLDRLQFDFIISGFKKIAYAERIEKMGSRVFYFPKKRKNPYKYYRELKKFFKNTGNKYDAIWFNSNDLANIDCLKLAKKVGIKTRIIHSHNSRITGTGLNAIRKKVFHQINKQNIVNIATDYWACSTVAANWMYPKNVRVKIIKNAISQKKFEFSNKKRKKLIKKYSLQNSVIIGNVGRLYFQKNQFFTIEVFRKFLKKVPNAKLVLVGDGPDRAKISKRLEALRLQDKVLLVGQQSDMQAWYSLFDIFLFPSLFEGLSVALLEAQANGVPILSSDRVSPNEIKLNNNFYYMSLNQGSRQWSRNLLYILYHSKRIDPVEIHNNFILHGYEIRTAAKRLEEFFEK